jgi:hypothetical protein
MTNSPLPLVRLADDISSSAAKQTVEKSGNKETVFWWKEGGWAAHILYYNPDKWSEVQMGWDTYIPVSQYPKLILLTPLALVGDVLMIPIAFMIPKIDG